MGIRHEPGGFPLPGASVGLMPVSALGPPLEVELVRLFTHGIQLAWMADRPRTDVQQGDDDRDEEILPSKRRSDTQRK